VARLRAEVRVSYVVFDLLELDGHPTLDLPYADRRRLLTDLVEPAGAWTVPAHQVGDGADLYAAAAAQGLEGLVAKRLDCPYLPGRRSQGWVKVKNVRNTDVVVGGWVGGDGERLGKIGALVIGFTTDDGELRYAGKVGTGFNEAELKRLQGIVDPLARDTTPFTGAQPEKATHFIEPTLVASVDYGDITDAGTLRHPVYKGLRDDLDPADAVAPADVLEP
jgi:bifunctional non-homologous end joining protein LigD